jgi:hypothetical protein
MIPAWLAWVAAVMVVSGVILLVAAYFAPTVEDDQ